MARISNARAGPSERSADVDIEAAVEHVVWCASHQSPGYVHVQTLKPTKSGGHVPQQAYWFHNKDLDLKKKLRAKLSEINPFNRMVLYTACSYSQREAKAEFALPSRLAFVDADQGVDSSRVPSPSRRIASSATGEHWFYVLSQSVAQDELQGINKTLTRAAGGDNGHSAAKKFRLPGFPNLKYKNQPIVKVIFSQEKRYHPHVLYKRLPLDKRRPAQEKDNAVRRPITDDKLKEILRKLNPKLDPTTAARLRQKRIYNAFNFRLGGKTCSYPGDNRSDIYWGIGRGLRDAGATPEETRHILPTTIFWKDREADGKVEDLDRLVEKIYNEEETANEHLDDSQFTQNSVLKIEDPTTWSDLPVPELEWIWKGWIPLGFVTLCYGDGGTGKTRLALMLAVSCAVGLPFLGKDVRKCRVFAFLAENSSSDTHRALAQICEAYGIGLNELSDLRVASRVGFDNVLMSFQQGKGEYADLYKELLAKILEFGPELVILETAADLFGGNENIRPEVRKFVGDCCAGIARATKGAVLVNAHPSVAGMRSGVGDGGSSAWSNTGRSRLYLYRELESNSAEDDPDVRILEVKKINEGKIGERLPLRWKDGIFVNEDSETRAGVIDSRDDLIVAEVRRAFDDDEPWSANHQSTHNYIVDWIKQHLHINHGAAKSRLSKLIRGKKIVEIVFNKNKHRKGLCTPFQAEKLRAKQSAKLRKNKS